MNKSPSLRNRNLRNLLLVVLLAASAAIAQALTVERHVTAAYVKEHPEELSVKVVEGKDGLLNFTVVRRLAEPRYLVAHLSVSHSGQIVAKSSTPSLGRKNDNTFHFSLLRADLAESKFTLGESAFGMSGEEMVPLPGTIDFQFYLQDFAPQTANGIVEHRFTFRV